MSKLRKGQFQIFFASSLKHEAILHARYALFFTNSMLAFSDSPLVKLKILSSRNGVKFLLETISFFASKLAFLIMGNIS